MSEFDEEAERERLREKYERDQKKRAATQRMSELLLKGATMTNSHCDTCGDPIFRHDGQAFCPTCQADGDAGEGSAADATGADAADAIADDGTPASTPDSAPASTGGSAAGSSTPASDATASGSRAADADGSRRAPSSVDPDLSSGPATDAAADSAGGPADVSPRSPDADADADPVGTARASLSRTLVRYARAAEDAEDPRRAAELLGAAREAAETLAALDPVR